MPYRIEYANSNRAGCKGPRPCFGTKILKGELRLGSLIEIQGSQSFHWRHWGCTTPKIIQNIQEKDGINNPTDLDGFEDLIPDDQARVARAFVDGHVASEDIPDSARYAADDADQTAAAAAVLPPAPSASAEKQPKKRGRPSKSSIEAAAATPPQAPIAAVPNGVGASIGTQPVKEKKRPGRPRKDAAGVLPAPVAPSPVPASVAAPGAPGAPVPKKRGRPPKNVAATSSPSPVLGAPVLPPAAAALPAVSQTAAAVAPQKKRGRPSKAALAAAPVAPAVPAQASHKKRGRPPKSATAAAAVAVAPAAFYTPIAAPPAKKRGRPSKTSLADAAAVAGAGSPAGSASYVPVHGSVLPLEFTVGELPDHPGLASAPTPSPKKRGRTPTNASAQPSASAVPVVPTSLPIQQSPAAPAAFETPVASPAKKRGRPKKNVDPATANAASLGQVVTPPLPRTLMPVQSPAQSAPAPPGSGKKRGRPPKEKVEGEEPVKRPRGRPKKAGDAVAPVSAAVLTPQPAPVTQAPQATAPATPAKKPRGRPKKNL